MDAYERRMLPENSGAVLPRAFLCRGIQRRGGGGKEGAASRDLISRCGPSTPFFFIPPPCHRMKREKRERLASSCSGMCKESGETWNWSMSVERASLPITIPNGSLLFRTICLDIVKKKKERKEEMRTQVLRETKKREKKQKFKLNACFIRWRINYTTCLYNLL